MYRIIQTALELGFGYAPVAIALFLSYRILDIADLSTDGCFVLGAAVSVSLAAGGHPLLGIVLAMFCGAAVGCLSAELQTYFGIPSILAGIIVNTGLYTVNELRREENKPDVEGGDVVLVSANLKSITDLSAQAPEGNPDGQGKKKEDEEDEE